MSIVTITIERDAILAISDFAENMLDDAPDGAAEPISEAIRTISEAIQKHDKALAQHAAEQRQRAETEAAAAAVHSAEVRIRITKTIRFKLGLVLVEGRVLNVTRRASSEWHHDDATGRSWWTVETSYTYTDPATTYNYGIPSSHATEVAS